MSRSYSDLLALSHAAIGPAPFPCGESFLKTILREVDHWNIPNIIGLSDAERPEIIKRLAGKGLSYPVCQRAAESQTQQPVQTQAGTTDDPDPPARNINAEIAKEQEILNRIMLDVIGERDNGAVVVFSLFHKKMAEICDVDRMKYPRLLQICGKPAKDHVVESLPDSPPPGVILFNEVKRAIGFCAGYGRLDESRISGPGCWLSLDDKLEPANSIVMVGAGEGATINGDVKIRRVINPRFGGRVLGLNNADEWYDFKQLRSYIDGYSMEWAEKVLGESSALFDRWAWRHQGISPFLMTGLALATWVQTIWAWRPQVEINGSKNTGKTTLFQALECIFGNLCELSSKSSAAGLRQSIQQTAKVMICDEFEKSKHRPEILEMIRASGRGDKIVMGTSHHVAKRFIVQHMFWIGAIESGLINAVDRSRFISMELVPPEPSKVGLLVLPPRQQLYDLGQKLLAIAVRNAIDARKLAIKLKAYRKAGIDQRVIENYAVPVAMLSAIHGETEEQHARKMLDTFLEGVANEDQKMSDEEDLLEAILRSNIRLGPNDERTVASLIESTHDHCMEALERNGVGVIYGKPGPRPVSRLLSDDWFLFVDHKDIASKLLFRSGADWTGKAIDKILKRIDGASVKQATIAGRRTLGVWIPLEFVRKNFLRPDENISEEKKF